MVTVKLYGMKGSTCTSRVAVVCNEIGVKYEIVKIDLAQGEHLQPEYIENMHPFGMIPVLEDVDGTKIYESRAVSRYLTAKYGKDSQLMPDASDPKAYGRFEQAASVEYSAFDPPAAKMVEQRFINKLIGIPVDEAAATSAEKLLKTKLEGYERILSKQKYLAGDRITLADLFHLPAGSYLDQYDPNILRSTPSVKRWWEDICSRESWKEASNLAFY
ncbi:hypothetical protein FRC08_008305 [Ceratobasidium sp. 394]|nr:hypothetical protein FRC08_008305 [Ceratobasidium sp. 394]